MRNRFAAAIVLSLGLLQACCNTTETAEYDPNSTEYLPAEYLPAEYLPGTDVAGWQAEAVPAPAPAVASAPAPSAAPGGLRPLERADASRSREQADLDKLRRSNSSLSERIARMQADVEGYERSRAAPPVVVAAEPVVAPEPVQPMEPAKPRITVEAVREILSGASIRDLPVSMNSSGNVVVTLPGSMSFGPGKAELMNTGRSRLSKMASVLAQEFPGVSARAEGHTDSDPIRKSGWASNQALSEARAKAVADYLAQETVLARNAVSHSGFGPTRPVASEDTREGKARNRRVEIVLVP